MNAPVLLAVLFLLLVLATLLRGLANQLRRQSGLPKGRVVYEDVSGLARRPLYSARLGLAGKPDYLLQDPQRNLIPVEVKAGAAPRNGQPYDSHRLQLAAYFLLVEETLQSPAPYGLIRYRDRTLRVANSADLRAQLLDVLAQMRALLRRGEARRSHSQPQRCVRCSLAHACDERLD